MTKQQNSNRPSWDTYFLNIAEAVAQRATCPRAKCGTVIVDPSTHQILSTGYNGSPPGEPHCIDKGCLIENNHCQRAIHSECNAICYAAKHGVRIDDAIAYIFGERANGEPIEVCRECKKILRSANITIKATRGKST